MYSSDSKPTLPLAARPLGVDKITEHTLVHLQPQAVGSQTSLMLFGNMASAVGILLPALLFAVLPLVTGTSSFWEAANVLVLFGAATSPSPVNHALDWVNESWRATAVRRSADPTAMANYIFGLVIAARIQSAVLTGMGLAGIYALITQPLEGRHTLHLANVLSFSISAAVHLHHLGLLGAEAPHTVMTGPVLESSKLALVVESLTAAINAVAFVLSRGHGVTPKFKRT